MAVGDAGVAAGADNGDVGVGQLGDLIGEGAIGGGGIELAVSEREVDDGDAVLRAVVHDPFQGIFDQLIGCGIGRILGDAEGDQLGIRCDAGIVHAVKFEWACGKNTGDRCAMTGDIEGVAVVIDEIVTCFDLESWAESTAEGGFVIIDSGVDDGDDLAGAVDGGIIGGSGVLVDQALPRHSKDRRLEASVLPKLVGCIFSRLSRNTRSVRQTTLIQSLRCPPRKAYYSQHSSRADRLEVYVRADRMRQTFWSILVRYHSR